MQTVVGTQRYSLANNSYIYTQYQCCSPVLLLILQLDIEGLGGAGEGTRGSLTVIAAVVVLVLKVIEEVKLIANSCNVHLRRVWGGVLTTTAQLYQFKLHVYIIAIMYM